MTEKLSLSLSLSLSFSCTYKWLDKQQKFILKMRKVRVYTLRRTSYIKQKFYSSTQNFFYTSLSLRWKKERIRKWDPKKREKYKEYRVLCGVKFNELMYRKTPHKNDVNGYVLLLLSSSFISHSLTQRHMQKCLQAPFATP